MSISQRHAVREFLSARLVQATLRARLAALRQRAEDEGRPAHRFFNPEERERRRGLIARTFGGSGGYPLHA